MAEATSHRFVARVGALTAETEARLIQWATSNCAEHAITRNEDGNAALYFVRAEPRTVRAVQALLRTLTSRWGMGLGKLQPNWLQPISHEEFRAAKDSCERPPTAEVDAEPHGGPQATTCVLPSGETRCAESILRLPPGFDRRSLALLATLRAQVTC